MPNLHLLFKTRNTTKGKHVLSYWVFFYVWAISFTLEEAFKSSLMKSILYLEERKIYIRQGNKNENKTKRRIIFFSLG